MFQVRLLTGGPILKSEKTMYMHSGVNVTAQQLLDRNLSLEEIQAYAQKHQAMLSGWMPETMADVESQAHTYRLCVRMRAFYARESTL
jgi:hypothetical protein